MGDGIHESHETEILDCESRSQLKCADSSPSTYKGTNSFFADVPPSQAPYFDFRIPNCASSSWKVALPSQRRAFIELALLVYITDTPYIYATIKHSLKKLRIFLFLNNSV
eukprot:TRINITY_DN1510_c0_g2_i1.p1 TRINITY_DN1510_c0_g2~~TRINITY_DN1510_c0_g2_i1.p1  ORF type:complete len:110 (+),score=4.61 TRINITY_DN1510_c0_g2_i1:435-764(+)